MTAEDIFILLLVFSPLIWITVRSMLQNEEQNCRETMHEKLRALSRSGRKMKTDRYGRSTGEMMEPMTLAQTKRWLKKILIAEYGYDEEVVDKVLSTLREKK